MVVGSVTDGRDRGGAIVVRWVGQCGFRSKLITRFAPS